MRRWTKVWMAIRREDGTVVDVGLDTDFRVIGTETDDADTGADDDA